MIDLHTHILPKIDDGSKRIEETAALLKLLKQQGVTTVAATPHFYAGHHTPEVFLQKRDAAEAALRQEMAKHSGLPQLHVGAEVSFFRGMSDSQQLEQLAIRGSSCILVEMPLPPWSDAHYRELEAIREKRGLTPIIAHIDRYIAPFRTHGIPARLAQLPVLVQANAGFFREWPTASMALRLLCRGQIHLLGSDCHNTDSRKPDLGAAVQIIHRKLGPEALERLNAWGESVL